MATPTDSSRETPQARPADAPTGSRGIKGLIMVVALAWGASQGWSWWKAHDLARSIKGKAQGDDILMLTTATCPYCEAARRWLDKHDVTYRECDVETDATCRAQFQARGSPGVPMLKVKGRWQLGFDPQWLVMALDNPAVPTSSLRSGQPQP